MQLTRKLDSLTRFFVALSIAAVFALPLLEQSHAHPGDQLTAVECEICIQLSSGDDIAPLDFGAVVPTATVQFISYQSESAAFGLLQRQRARAPPVS